MPGLLKKVYKQNKVIYSLLAVTHNFVRHHAPGQAWCPWSFFFFTPGCTWVIFICLVTFYTTAYSLLVCSSTPSSFITWYLLHTLYTIFVFSELRWVTIFFPSPHLHFFPDHCCAVCSHGVPSAHLCSVSYHPMHASVPIPAPRPLLSYQVCISLHDIAMLEP